MAGSCAGTHVSGRGRGRGVRAVAAVSVTASWAGGQASRPPPSWPRCSSRLLPLAVPGGPVVPRRMPHVGGLAGPLSWWLVFSFSKLPLSGTPNAQQRLLVICVCERRGALEAGRDGDRLPGPPGHPGGKWRQARDRHWVAAWHGALRLDACRGGRRGLETRLFGQARIPRIVGFPCSRNGALGSFLLFSSVHG